MPLLFALLAVPGRVLGRRRAVRPPRRRARRGGHGRLPVPHLLRAGDADVLARRRPVAAGVGELRARVRARPPRAPGAARAVDALLLYTHAWGLFLAVGMAVAWLWLWHEGRVEGRDGALLAARRRAALTRPGCRASPSRPPTPPRRGPRARRSLHLLGIPGSLFGYVAAAAAGARGHRRAAPPWRARGRAAAGTDRGGRRLAWRSWARSSSRRGRRATSRWLFGPLLLALAAVLVARQRAGRGRRSPGVLGVWLVSGPAPAKSNVRAVAATVAPALRPGDLVVSTPASSRCRSCTRYLPQRACSSSRPWGRSPSRGSSGTGRTAWPGCAAGTAERVLAPLRRACRRPAAASCS